MLFEEQEPNPFLRDIRECIAYSGLRGQFRAEETTKNLWLFDASMSFRIFAQDTLTESSSFPVTHISFTLYPSKKETSIDTILTLPPFRGRGFARKMVDLVEQSAQNWGHSRVSLQPSDSEASKFWGHVGYVPSKRAGIYEKTFQ